MEDPIGLSFTGTGITMLRAQAGADLIQLVNADIEFENAVTSQLDGRTVRREFVNPARQRLQANRSGRCNIDGTTGIGRQTIRR